MRPCRGMGAVSPQKLPQEGAVSFKAGGLYENIHKKRARIKAGSGEKMRKPGSAGAPTDAAFTAAAKTRKTK